MFIRVQLLPNSSFRCGPFPHKKWGDVYFMFENSVQLFELATEQKKQQNIVIDIE